MNPDTHAEEETLWGTRPMRWALRMFDLDGRALAASLPLHKALQIASLLQLELPSPTRGEEFVEILVAAAEQKREFMRVRKERPNHLERNLAHLKHGFGLNPVELNLLAFCALIRLNPAFGEVASKYIGPCTQFVFQRQLAALFELPRRAIERALAQEARLIQSGLAGVTTAPLSPVEDRVHLKRGLVDLLIGQHKTPADLLSSLLPRKCQAQLKLADYPHLCDEVNLLRDFLREAIDTRKTGTNVLLHGAPGTGKSQLSAAIAAVLGDTLYEVPSTHAHGPAMTPRERLLEIMQSQRVVHEMGSGLVLVDEAEDLFPTIWSDSEKTPTKAAVNVCLERNPAPTIWISNRVRHMDEAFLRRFDLIIHVSALPANAKCKLLRDSLPPEALNDRELRRYAAQRELSPAMITRLAQVATSGAHNDPGLVRDNFRIVSSQYLRTLGALPIPSADASASLQYDPDLLNTDPPSETLLNAMGDSRSGARMLLHGPPGTGKTALGKALAERLDIPLLQRQASSLLSMWVGETEHNLRDMFDEARREEGVLLLDEADSFLRDRSRARAHWEVTQTNELLTQMEAFEGFFLCTTNRLDDLDPAALRRFDFKVEFKPLRPEQRLRLLRQCCDVLGITSDLELEAVQAKLRRLDGLTPGDAAATLRRLRISTAMPALSVLLEALRDECRYKPMPAHPIGFVH